MHCAKWPWSVLARGGISAVYQAVNGIEASEETKVKVTPENPQIILGTRIRKSRFFDATGSFGSQAYTSYNHMYMPLYYESPEADYWHLINEVTIWFVACERLSEITGADAYQFARLMTSGWTRN